MLVAEGAGTASGKGRGFITNPIGADDPPVARSDSAASAARRSGSGVLAFRLYLELAFLLQLLAQAGEVEHARLVFSREIVGQALARTEAAAVFERVGLDHAVAIGRDQFVSTELEHVERSAVAAK